MASLAPIEVFSDDPEVMALQALIKGLRHFGNNPNLTMRHFKVLAAVELCLKLAKRPATVEDIEQFSRLKAKEFEVHLRELVEYRYLHAVVNTFGPATERYKLGSMGGTAIRTMFKHVKAVTAAADNE
jgi:RIO-like serine/threonine protein kinase